MSLPELTRVSTNNRTGAPPPRERNIFTVRAADETLGLPVECVHTIFRVAGITPVPRGPREVVGLANLRGKIVTVASLRRRLGHADREGHASQLAIGIEHLGESFALMVDEVGDVMTVSEANRIQAPSNLSSARLGVTSAVYRLDGAILSVLDMASIFQFSRARPERNFSNTRGAIS